MFKPPELRVSGPNGETEVDLGTVIISARRITNLTIALQNTSRQQIFASFRLSKPLAEMFSVSSVHDVTPNGSHQHRPSVLPADPGATLNRNLVHDYIRDPLTLEIPGDSRRLYCLSLHDVSISSSLVRASVSREKAGTLAPFDGYILLQDFDTSVKLTEFKVRGVRCESWIHPDLELLDFGHCALGAWVYRDINIRNLSQVPARCCFSHSFRPTLEPERVTELSFIDPESGYELDPKIIRLEQASTRCIRIAFRATAPVQRDYWLCLQNLDNAEDFWHLRTTAKVGAERIAQKILVSCGAELDFGDCYVNYQTFRDVTVQSNYEEDVSLSLMTDRPNEISFEILNDWSMEETAEAAPKKPRARTNIEYDPSNLLLSDTSEMRPLNRQLSLLAENISDQETVSPNTGSLKYYSPQQTDREERPDARKLAKKRNRLPERVIVRPGQKKGVRVWYLPAKSSRKRLAESKEVADLDSGALQDDTFLLTFELSSGERRTAVCQSRVCESVVRLEREEVQLGNCNVMTRYRTTLSLINCSDLPAFVNINYVSQCVFADTHECRISPRQAYDLGLEFIPRQVNSGYHKEVTVSNLRNPNAPNLVFTLRADCVDDQGISLHALFYKLLASSPTNEIDFGVTVANHPAIRAIKVRNITDKRLILEFDQCSNVTTYLPACTMLDATRYQNSLSRESIITGKCVCQTKPISASLRTKAAVFDSAAHNTADALVDMDISRLRQEPGSTKRQNLPVWRFESCLAKLQQYSNPSGQDVRSSAMKTRLQRIGKHVEPIQERRKSCWVDYYSSMSEGKVTMLDLPTFFSNYDSEMRYTEQQFRPEENLRSAIRAGCLTATTTLVLKPKSESVVLLSLSLNDRDVRGKTKIRPIEKHLSIRMVEFDRSRLRDLPETSSQQMHHIATLFEKGEVCRPREVLLTVQACKSRMSIGPLRQLNFGTITCGKQKDKAFTIVNLSEAPLLYEIRKVGIGNSNDIRLNLGRGTRGVVRPYFTKVVPFIFAPSREGKFEERIVVENRLDRSASSGLIVKAQIRLREDSQQEK